MTICEKCKTSIPIEDTHEQKLDNTHEAMLNPRKGDRFQEFYSHWVYVVKVSKYSVWTMSASAPCTFPKDGKLEKRSREEFKKYYAYQSPNLPNKYWIKLCDRDNDVSGWVLANCKKRNY